MSARTCDVCKYDGGIHYDDSDPTQPPRAYRCPNYIAAEIAQAAAEYDKGETTKAKEAAHEVIEDAAYTMLILDANRLEEAFDIAQIPEGLRPGAFTWAKNKGLIEKLGRRVMREKKSTRHPVEQWRSLVHGKRREAS